MIRLNVSSLSPSMTKNRFKEVFEEYSKADSVKIQRGSGENTSVMDFVFMTREGPTLDALKELDGK
ncbi:MAG: hypothetical protein AB8H47_14305 [Bacteroidia bacterium]